MRAFVTASLLVLAANVLCACDEPLPQLMPLPAMTLKNQHGTDVTLKTLSGRPWVANFIFTSCPDVCPLLTEKMRGLRERLGDHGTRMRFVSFTVDPKTDTPARLKAYAAAHGASFENWWFLTGPVDDLKHAVVNGFKQAMEPVAASNGRPANILHGSHFVLVDAQAVIRGFYASDDEGLKALADAARQLVNEGTH